MRAIRQSKCAAVWERPTSESESYKEKRQRKAAGRAHSQETLRAGKRLNLRYR